MGAQQWKNTRLSDSTAAADIDNHVVNLEHLLQDIFGADSGDRDTDLPNPNEVSSDEPFADLDTQFRIKNALRFYGAGVDAASPDHHGIRLRDSDSGDEYLLSVGDNKMVMLENTGTEASPTWTERWSVALDTGESTDSGSLDGAVAHDSSSHSLAGGANAQATLYDTEDLDTGSFFDGSNYDRVYVPDDGILYEIVATMMWVPSASDALHDALRIEFDGGVSVSGPDDAVAYAVKKTSAGTGGTFYANLIGYVKATAAGAYQRIKVTNQGSNNGSYQCVQISIKPMGDTT